MFFRGIITYLAFAAMVYASAADGKLLHSRYQCTLCSLFAPDFTAIIKDCLQDNVMKTATLQGSRCTIELKATDCPALHQETLSDLRSPPGAP